MPDTQKKIEEFVEEEKAALGIDVDHEHSPNCDEDCELLTVILSHQNFSKYLRRAIAFGLRLSCEMGPERKSWEGKYQPEAEEDFNPMYASGGNYDDAWSMGRDAGEHDGHNSALTQRDEACLAEAERVEKG